MRGGTCRQPAAGRVACRVLTHEGEDDRSSSGLVLGAESQALPPCPAPLVRDSADRRRRGVEVRRSPAPASGVVDQPCSSVWPWAGLPALASWGGHRRSCRAWRSPLREGAGRRGLAPRMPHLPAWIRTAHGPWGGTPGSLVYPTPSYTNLLRHPPHVPRSCILAALPQRREEVVVVMWTAGDNPATCSPHAHLPADKSIKISTRSCG